MFLIISFVWATGVLAAIPHTINYQGRLTDSSGVPLTGAYDVIFRIYDAQTAGNLLWQETHVGVVVEKGLFNVVLGSISDLNIAFDKPYYLEIKVGDEVMSPRQQITSAGYSIRTETAENAEKLGAKLPSEYLLAGDVTSVPTANKAVKMDANGKLPLAALKTYDSGWFAVSMNGTVYTKTHNLGTNKVICKLYGATDSGGTNMSEINASQGEGHYNCVWGITTTQIKVSFGGNDAIMTSGTARTDPTYARIILLALE
jgi:hypothetical protein